MIWGIISFSDCLHSVKIEDHTLSAPTSTHLMHLTSPLLLPALSAGFARLAHLLRRLQSASATAELSLISTVISMVTIAIGDRQTIADFICNKAD